VGPHLAFGPRNPFFAGRSGTPSARPTLDVLVDSCAHMNFAEIPVRRASPWVSGGEQVHLRAPH